MPDNKPYTHSKMILFNTTFIVDPTLKTTFLDWAKTTLIPRTLASGLFTDPLAMRVLPPEIQAEPCETESYAIQFKSSSLEAATAWAQSGFLELFAPLAKQYPQAILPFSTFMEII